MNFCTTFNLTAIQERHSKTRHERLANEFFKSVASRKAPENDDARLTGKNPVFGAEYGKTGATLQVIGSGSGGKSTLAEESSPWAHNLCEDQLAQSLPVWMVVLHNNDLTPFINVERTLSHMFDLSPSEANELMSDAHEGGALGYAVVAQGLRYKAATLLASQAEKHAAALPYQNGGVLKFSAQRLVLQ